MDKFVMCPDCQKEYRDPSDRRFTLNQTPVPNAPAFELADNQGNCSNRRCYLSSRPISQEGHSAMKVWVDSF
jgi:hydrogenase maturation factor HypF (carbamoyltransferase family)